MTSTTRVRCPDCEDWVCLRHGEHVGVLCDCEPCDDCGELWPPDDLDEWNLCPDCLELEGKRRAE
jgi:hypothetical protein